MKAVDLEQLLEQWHRAKMELNRRKRQDYAGDDDALWNFDTTAAICKLLDIDVQTPDGVALFFVIHKLIRVANLRRRDGVENEPFEDSVQDSDVYLDLFRAILIEKGQIE